VRFKSPKKSSKLCLSEKIAVSSQPSAVSKISKLGTDGALNAAAGRMGDYKRYLREDFGSLIFTLCKITQVKKTKAATDTFMATAIAIAPWYSA